MLNPGGEEERITPETYAARDQEAMRTAHSDCDTGDFISSVSYC